MACYMEDYRARICTRAGRFAFCVVARRDDASGATGDCFGFTVLSSMVLAVLQIIAGVEQNPGLLWKWKTPCDSYVVGAEGI